MTDEQIVVELERQLAEIPILKFMGVSLVSVKPGRVILKVPFDNSQNQQGMVFSGASASAMFAAGWCLVVSELLRRDMHNRVVISHPTIDFVKPLTEDFYVEAVFEDHFNLEDYLHTACQPIIKMWAVPVSGGPPDDALQISSSLYYILPAAEE